MRKTLTLFLSIILVSLVVFAEQVQDTKEPMSGAGCASVISKLRNLTVGKMRVKKCCGDIVLFAEVKQENGKKTIDKWIVEDSNGAELKAMKGWDDATRSMVIRTEDKRACFIVEKKTN
jgi:hypothetical protein